MLGLLVRQERLGAMEEAMQDILILQVRQVIASANDGLCPSGRKAADEESPGFTGQDAG